MIFYRGTSTPCEEIREHGVRAPIQLDARGARKHIQDFCRGQGRDPGDLQDYIERSQRPYHIGVSTEPNYGGYPYRPYICEIRVPGLREHDFTAEVTGGDPGEISWWFPKLLLDTDRLETAEVIAVKHAETAQVTFITEIRGQWISLYQDNTCLAAV